MPPNSPHPFRAFKSLVLGWLILLSFVNAASASDVEEYLAKLHSHYEKTRSISAFSLKLHFLNRQYRDENYWDFQSPNVHMSQRLVEVDLAKRHFYDNDILYFAGGRLFDRVQFQNDTESLFYEKSATSIGRAVLPRGMDNFDRFRGHILLNVDFLAVRPLLEETDIANSVTLRRGRAPGTTVLGHENAEGGLISYHFRDDPVQLVSIDHQPLTGFFVYDNYQTNRGLTYARTVTKYYGSETEPTYISFNDDFDVIDGVDPAKLRLPDGYGPMLEPGDGVLISEQIGKDLYLVTDSAAIANVLLKVSGDKITVFGGAVGIRTAENILSFARDQFPQKRVRSVYVTHPQGNQTAGLKVFADQGITILADDYTIAALKAGSRFGGDAEDFHFTTTKHGDAFDGMRFFVLENLHSKRQGFVYFQDSGIIFQSHFLHVPRDNTIAKVVPSYSRAFIDFIRAQNLTIKRIVGNYRNNNITPAIVDKTYEASVSAKSRFSQ
ncbi:MAG: hypothetical protein JJ850_02140 [Kordiimonadaceae bacterium]|nr:hypothetical protein [Kordiimonadaceae bacterium]MBO6567396.1 hypothetical protein [Kordiimonadaceae bacterium]MBO6963390.1 hypothetical protein [Kordiimonadaceae bacterium]